MSWPGSLSQRGWPYEDDDPYISEPGEPGYPEPGDDDAWFARFEALMRKAEKDPEGRGTDSAAARILGVGIASPFYSLQVQHSLMNTHFRGVSHRIKP